jgi:mannobiose 2-epimerase
MKNYNLTVNFIITLIHILEGYVNLFRIWYDSVLEKKIYRFINILVNKTIGQKIAYSIYLIANWKLINKVFSYGYDIEIDWLLIEASTEWKNRILLKEIQQISINLIDTI